MFIAQPLRKREGAMNAGRLMTFQRLAAVSQETCLDPGLLFEQRPQQFSLLPGGVIRWRSEPHACH
jgi:hypothetical protein